MISLSESEVTKRLAAWGALITVPTLIAGIYGMNFEHMPELEWAIGYPFALLVMLVVDARPLLALPPGAVAVAPGVAPATRSARISAVAAPAAVPATGATGMTRRSRRRRRPRRLQRDVVDAEIAREHPLRRGQRSQPGLAVGQRDVRGQRDPLRAHGPDVQVVDAGHARQRGQRAADRVVGQVRAARAPSARRSTPAAAPSVERRIRSATTSDSSGSTGVQPVKWMTAPATSAATDPSRSPNDVQQRAARVDAPARARQHPGDDAVDGEASGGDHHHQRARDRRRARAAAHRLDRDPDDQRQHRQRVDERGEDFGPRVAVRRAARRRALGDDLGDQRDHEPRRVGRHVPGIRNQRERARKQAADRLDDTEGGGKPERDGERAHHAATPRASVW